MNIIQELRRRLYLNISDNHFFIVFAVFIGIMKINALNSIFISSLIALLSSGCDFKNPVKPESKHYEIVVQPGPEDGEDTFVKYEYNPFEYPSITYEGDNFGDSSRIQIGYIGYPFANKIVSEGLFKIPNASSLEDSLNIDSISVSLYGKAWNIPFSSNFHVFKANGIIEYFEENSTCWNDLLRSDMVDYDMQTVDTTWGWITWNLGDYSRLKHLNGIVIRPLEYGIYWLSDYEAYSSDEMDSVQFRPRYIFYCSTK
jgi:hypothetical protein